MLGVIEGFYGKSWTQLERLDMIDFLSRYGFGAYCFAPKSCRKLRQDISILFTGAEMSDLQALSGRCNEKGLQFYVGISPHDYLYTRERSPFRQKLDQLLALESVRLAVFFDDVEVGDHELAGHQIEFMDQISEWAGGGHMLYCPTFYSSDKVLVELFGNKPHGYWEDLGKGLSREVDIFWTGESVITEQYGIDHLNAMTRIFQRKPLIWDNAFVNDGRKTSPFLPVGKIANYQAALPSASGIFINPMNQAALSKINLLMAVSGMSLEVALDEIAPEVKAFILRNLALLTETGLDHLDEERRAALLEELDGLTHPVAKNIADWLQGVYRFDPQCLT